MENKNRQKTKFNAETHKLWGLVEGVNPKLELNGDYFYDFEPSKDQLKMAEDESIFQAELEAEKAAAIEEKRKAFKEKRKGK